MRKVDEIKKEQGFVKKAPNCSNCQYFTSKIVPLKWNPDYKRETNLRCSIGNFKVGKSNWCKLHKFKNDTIQNKRNNLLGKEEKE